jgi:hypothetical protein
MAATTRRIKYTKTRTYTVYLDFPNSAGGTFDADLTTAAKLPNGALALAELLAASSAYNGGTAITNAGSSPWTAGVASDIEAYAVWTPSTALAVGNRVAPTTPTQYLYQVTAVTGDAKTATTEPTWPTTGTVVSGNVTMTTINKF